MSISQKLVLDTKRHSFAQLMAAAVKQIFPEVLLGIGEITETGCFYDFASSKVLDQNDLQKIEITIRNLLTKNLDLETEIESIYNLEFLFKRQSQSLKVNLLNNFLTQYISSNDPKIYHNGIQVAVDFAKSRENSDCYVAFNLNKSALRLALLLDLTEYFYYSPTLMSPNPPNAVDYTLFNDFLIIRMSNQQEIDNFLYAVSEFIDHLDTWFDPERESFEDFLKQNRLNISDLTDLKIQANNFNEEIRKLQNILVVSKIKNEIKYHQIDIAGFDDIHSVELNPGLDESKKDIINDILWSKNELEEALKLISNYEPNYKTMIRIYCHKLLDISQTQSQELVVDFGRKLPVKKPIEYLKSHQKKVFIIPSKFINNEDLPTLREYGELESFTHQNCPFYKIMIDQNKYDEFQILISNALASEYKENKIKYALIGTQIVLADCTFNLSNKDEILLKAGTLKLTQEDLINLNYLVNKNPNEIEFVTELDFKLDIFTQLEANTDYQIKSGENYFIQRINATIN
jgi:hypothetical protein